MASVSPPPRTHDVTLWAGRARWRFAGGICTHYLHIHSRQTSDAIPPWARSPPTTSLAVSNGGLASAADGPLPADRGESDTCVLEGRTVTTSSRVRTRADIALHIEASRCVRDAHDASSGAPLVARAVHRLTHLRGSPCGACNLLESRRGRHVGSTPIALCGRPDVRGPFPSSREDLPRPAGQQHTPPQHGHSTAHACAVVWLCVSWCGHAFVHHSRRALRCCSAKT